jgi:hypothetical protein
VHLAAVGRRREAITEALRAQELEPLAPVWGVNVGWFYYLDHPYGPAEVECRKVIEMEPNHASGHNCLGSIYLQTGRSQEAIAELQQRLDLSQHGMVELTYLGHAFGVSGALAKALKVLDEIPGEDSSRPGANGSSGDGGPATAAQLNSPRAVTADSEGNLYISGDGFCGPGSKRVRKVAPDGTISTVAGTETPGFSGDGGIALSAQFTCPQSVALDAGGNLFISDAGNHRIREVLAAVPFSANPASRAISLSGVSGGKPVTTSFSATTFADQSRAQPIPGMNYSVQVASNSPCISVSPQGGMTPGLVTITADPSNLSPGPYSSTVAINVPGANPQSTAVAVQFTVGAAVPARLSVDRNHLSFTYASTSAARTQTITVSNNGGGPLPFTVSIAPNAGPPASWLSVTPMAGAATPALPTVLTVAADPSNLPPGTYAASILIGSSAGSATVTAVMTISTNPLIMLLSQTGLTFTAVQNGGGVSPQTFSVLNLGSGTLNWTAQTSVLGGVNNGWPRHPGAEQAAR